MPLGWGSGIGAVDLLDPAFIFESIREIVLLSRLI